MAPKLLFDLDSIDLSSVQYSLEEIREMNAQRHEFEQLTAIVKLCPERKMIVGLRDIGHGEFWERGHVPGNPLFPAGPGDQPALPAERRYGETGGREVGDPGEIRPIPPPGLEKAFEDSAVGCEAEPGKGSGRGEGAAAAR